MCRRSCGRRPREVSVQWTSKHGQLMAEHQALGIFGAGVHPVNANNLERPTDQSVGEAEAARAISLVPIVGDHLNVSAPDSTPVRPGSPRIEGCQFQSSWTLRVGVVSTTTRLVEPASLRRK